MQILIIDQSRSDAAAIAEFVVREGHQAWQASEVEEALSLLIHFRFDAIICDVARPDYFGPDFLGVLKVQAPHLPLIAISRRHDELWHDACLEAGANAFLPKPINPVALRDEIRWIAQAKAQIPVVLLAPLSSDRQILVQQIQSLGCELRLPSSQRTAMELAPALGARAIWAIDLELLQGDDLLTLLQSLGAQIVLLGVDPDSQNTWLRRGAALALTKPFAADQLVAQLGFLSQNATPAS